MELPGTSRPSEVKDRAFSMVDVGEKPATYRRAVATGRIEVGPEAFARIEGKTIPKGDVLALAEIAGIQGAKRTSEWLPLCHPLLIDRATVTLTLEKSSNSVLAQAEVCGTGKTGFEMEALTAVSAALLCVYDLVKAIEPRMKIGDVVLVEKEGGKSGHWKNAQARRVEKPEPKPFLKDVACAVLTVSDRVSRGLAVDESSVEIATRLEAWGAASIERATSSDDTSSIAAHLKAWAPRVSLILLTGGTGVSPRDVTPEAVESVCDRLIPGIGEKLRLEGSRHTQMSWLSRSVAGLLGQTLIVALPGSRKAVAEGMATLESILPHALHIARGGDHVRHKA